MNELQRHTPRDDAPRYADPALVELHPTPSLLRRHALDVLRRTTPPELDETAPGASGAPTTLFGIVRRLWAEARRHVDVDDAKLLVKQAVALAWAVALDDIRERVTDRFAGGAEASEDAG